MALFGELRFDRSRAIDEDEDEEFTLSAQDEALKRRIFWQTDFTDQKLKVDELIVADGPLSTAFVNIYLLNRLQQDQFKLLGVTATSSEYKIFETNYQDSLNEQKQEHPFVFMRNNYIFYLRDFNGKSIVLCQFYNQLKENELFDWINQLWSRVEFDGTLVFCNRHRAQYLGPNELEFPLIRFVSTNVIDNSSESNCMTLEQPNFLTDLPAALVQLCLLKNLRYLTYVCYTSSLKPDLDSIKKFYTNVSAHLKEQNYFIENEDSKKLLLSISNMVSDIATLYT